MGKLGCVRKVYGVAKMDKKDKSHVFVKMDCGIHFGRTGGVCEKCKDKATSMAAQRRIDWYNRKDRHVG